MLRNLKHVQVFI